MRTLIRRLVMSLAGLGLLASPITVVGGTLEHRHVPHELAVGAIQELGVGVRVAG